MQKTQNPENNINSKNNTNIVKNSISDNKSAILELVSEYVQLYIESKRATNLSEKTIYNATTILERFYDFIADELAENEILTINDINKYFLTNYLNKLTEAGIGKSTQKLHLTIIKGFLWFIADSDIKLYGFLKLNINGLRIKTEQKEKDSFAQAEQTRLLNYVKILDTKKSYLAQRNALLIKMLFYTGMRISEIINIKWSDITEYEDDNHGFIYVILVKGKGNKERFTYLAYSEIASNLEFIKETKLSEYVFTSTHGYQCNRSSLFLVVRHILRKANIFKSGLHIFRHTFARSLVDKEVNLATIKDLLGHSNISVTAQFYAKSNENAKRNALFRK